MYRFFVTVSSSIYFLFFIKKKNFSVAKPLLLGTVLTYYSREEYESNKSDIILYSAILSACIVTNTFVHHMTAFLGELTDLKVKAALSSLIYKKSLKLNSNSNVCGQAITLMTKDANIIEYVYFSLYQTVISPINLITMTTIMYTKIGISAVIGTVLLLLLIPFQGNYLLELLFFSSFILNYYCRVFGFENASVQA